MELNSVCVCHIYKHMYIILGSRKMLNFLIVYKKLNVQEGEGWMIIYTDSAQNDCPGRVHLHFFPSL